MDLKMSVILVLTVSALGAMSCAGGKEVRTDVANAENSDTADKNQAAPDKQKPALKTVNVETKKLSLETMTESALAHGVTKADHEITYSAEIAGKIEYMGFELGDEVKKGKILARIDFKTLKAQANQAEAQYTLAKTTYDRLAKLKGEELVSHQQYDEAYSNMVSAEAQLAIAKANLSKSTIRANRFGVVAQKYIEKSEYVGPGTRLYDLVDYRHIIVEAQLAESQVADIRTGSKVTVEISALKQNYEGTVDTILPTAHHESKTFTVRVRIPNPDLKILIGMSTKLHINAKEHADVILANQNAILEEQNGARYVFVAKDGKAEKRVVKTGAYYNDKVVLLEGVSQGDDLIVLGHRDLLHGQPIRLIN